MRLYIANRGEIARRIIRTAKRLGIPTSVGYSTIDRELPFVREADRAVEVPSPNARDPYLDMDRVIETAKKCGATHLHPGYGFLSENADFVDQLDKAGIRFVGPPADAMRKLGDKVGSRRFLKKLKIPLLPSTADDHESLENFRKFIQAVGCPVLLKPSAGGGGKGMFVIRHIEELEEKMASSKRTALASFKDDRIFLEKFVERARHIEVQIIADQGGNVYALGERECSLQRRHQKVMEESPSVPLPQKLREKILEASREVTKSVGYTSAGTVEWIWDGKDGIYFLEVNARLQVEHPVTESCTGLDLVEQQLRVAAGETLQLSGIKPSGHSMEFRICAEDPAQEFLPSGGKIFRLSLPTEIARCDFGYEEKNSIPMDYDSLIGKVIVTAANRQECLEKSRHALEKLVVMGPTTNRSYLLQLLADPRVQKAEIFTNLLQEIPYRFDALAAMTALKKVKTGGGIAAAVVEDEEGLDLYSPWGASAVHQQSDFFIEDNGDKRFFYFPFADWTEKRETRITGKGEGQPGAQGPEPQIKSPMPSKVIQVSVKEGQEVKAGDLLLILEAMKMELKVKAKSSGRVKSILVKEGDQVPPDQLLLELDLDKK